MNGNENRRARMRTAPAPAKPVRNSTNVQMLLTCWAVQPEVVGVFVDHENLCRQAGCQHPLPFWSSAARWSRRCRHANSDGLPVRDRACRGLDRRGSRWCGRAAFPAGSPPGEWRSRSPGQRARPCPRTGAEEGACVREWPVNRSPPSRMAVASGWRPVRK